MEYKRYYMGAIVEEIIQNNEKLLQENNQLIEKLTAIKTQNIELKEKITAIVLLHKNVIENEGEIIQKLKELFLNSKITINADGSFNTQDLTNYSNVNVFMAWNVYYALLHQVWSQYNSELILTGEQYKTYKNIIDSFIEEPETSDKLSAETGESETLNQIVINSKNSLEDYAQMLSKIKDLEARQKFSGVLSDVLSLAEVALPLLEKRKDLLKELDEISTCMKEQETKLVKIVADLNKPGVDEKKLQELRKQYDPIAEDFEIKFQVGKNIEAYLDKIAINPIDMPLIHRLNTTYVAP